MRMERADAKIVAMSGSGGVHYPDYRAMAVKLGADRGIEKLCHAEALISELQCLLAPEPQLSVTARAA
jgi:hypothetical protein